MAEDKVVDVLILGAGLSGLAAAFHLQKRSPHLTFLVAEANDRIGGRSLSIEVQGPQGQTDVLDLGGHWVCQRQKDIMNLINELGGIEYYPQNVTGMKKPIQAGEIIDSIFTFSRYQSDASWSWTPDQDLQDNHTQLGVDQGPD